MSDIRVRRIPLPELREHLNHELAKNPFINADPHDPRTAQEDEAPRRAEEDKRKERGEGGG